MNCTKLLHWTRNGRLLGCLVPLQVFETGARVWPSYWLPVSPHEGDPSLLFSLLWVTYLWRQLVRCSKRFFFYATDGFMSSFTLGWKTRNGSQPRIGFSFFQKKSLCHFVVIWEPGSPMGAPLTASLRTQSTPPPILCTMVLMLLSRAPAHSSSREESPVRFIK